MAMEGIWERAARAMRERASQIKDLAGDASKTADQFRGLALDGAEKMKATVLAAAAAASSTVTPKQSPVDEQELEKYGITSELQDFLQGLTIDTFKAFPLGDDEMEEPDTLSLWKERHALLVLSAVPEVSAFRYALCPKHIKDKRFWRIYFTLVAGHIAKYLDSQEMKHQDSKPGATDATINSSDEPEIERSELPKSTMTDEDLDNYLLGALESSEADEEHLEGDETLDAEFEKLVNDATELDSEDEKMND